MENIFTLSLATSHSTPTAIIIDCKAILLVIPYSKQLFNKFVNILSICNYYNTTV